mmetsp:Transcript_25730/g.28817  ORF Transcript_25730/g.28817 Transcript_25730/m.28817 type:complete len:174 (+) Transcript_25730:76-597(+)
MLLKAYTTSYSSRLCVGRHYISPNFCMNIFSITKLKIKFAENFHLPLRTLDYIIRSTYTPTATISTCLQPNAIYRYVHPPIISDFTFHRDFESLMSTYDFRGISMMREKELHILPSFSSSIFSWAIWLIKRTYQPSLLKKKRKCGYLKRRQTVGGRKILKRRRQKGRKRLFGA